MAGVAAIVSLVVAGACALAVALDLFSHPQPMWIMNLVWPLTALWAGPLAIAHEEDSSPEAVAATIKADALSLSAWQGSAMSAAAALI